MDARDLKRILAGIAVSGLLAGSNPLLAAGPEKGKSG